MATITAAGEQLSDASHRRISSWLYQRTGIVLGETKKYLVQSRLSSLVRAEGLQDVEGLTKILFTGDNPELDGQVINALTTNETSWFRDQIPFAALSKTIFPRLKERKGPAPIQILSAASSTGQEAYGLAILACESNLFSHRQINITGIDISTSVLETARQGCYSSHEIARGMPDKLRDKYFAEDEDGWRLDQRVRESVKFKHYHLQQNMSALGRFDLIFCRNVLIYFDLDTKKQILTNIHRALSPNGLMATGGSESLFMLSEDFAAVRIDDAIYYSKADDESWNEFKAQPTGNHTG